MSLGIHPIFKGDGERPAYATDGVVLARNYELLDELAEEAGLILLSDFNGSMRDPAEDFDGDPDELELPEAEWRWFEPQPALETAQYLIATLEGNVLLLPDKETRDELLDELRALEQALAAAQARGLQFMLRIG
jgi:hypothetical protein